MRNFLILVCFSLFIWSCKKKKQNTIEPNPESPYTTSTAESFSGFFESASYTIVPAHSRVVTGSNSLALFYKEPIAYMDPLKGISVSELLHNDVVLKQGNGDPTYLSSSFYDLSKESWQVIGASGIPSFTYTSNDNDPRWSGFSSIPDTIKLDGKYTFTLTANLSNVTIASLTLMDGTHGNNGKVIGRELKTGENVFAFTANELSAFAATDMPGTLEINIWNTYALNFYGMDFRFEKSRRLSKEIVFIP